MQTTAYAAKNQKQTNTPLNGLSVKQLSKQDDAAPR